MKKVRNCFKVYPCKPLRLCRVTISALYMDFLSFSNDSHYTTSCLTCRAAEPQSRIAQSVARLFRENS